MGEPFVPKFGNFGFKKLKQTSTADEDGGSSSASRGTEGSNKNGHINESAKRSASRARTQDVRPHGLKRRRSEHPVAASDSVELADSEASKLFISDRRGDLKNFEFGYLHRYDVPKFHRLGARRVVGLGKDLKLDHEREHDKDIRLVHRSQEVRHEKFKGLSGSRPKREEGVVDFIRFARGELKRDDVDQEYIPLSTYDRASENDEGSKSGSTIPLYRSLHDDGQPTYRSQPGYLDRGPNPSRELETSETSGRKRNAELASKTKQNPTEPSVWLKFAEHQSTMIHPDIAAQNFSTSERRALADVRLAILAEALKSVRKEGLEYERLLLSWIEEGSILWDAPKIATKWREVLEKVPHSSLLWYAYLGHIEDSPSFTRYDDRKRAYIESLQVLEGVRQRLNTVDALNSREIGTQIVLRLTILMRSAGYEELAIATWQALLEYFFFRPEQLTGESFHAQATDLEDFWEVDVPRIGEADAQGWKNSINATADQQPRKTTAPPALTLANVTAWRVFATQEMQALREFWLPAATMDDDSAEDPFRFVMFSDMKEVILHVDPDTSKSMILSGFLQFLNLPSLGRTRFDPDVSTGMTNEQLKSYLGSFGLHDDAKANDSTSLTETRTYQETTYTLLHGAFTRICVRHEDEGRADDGLARFIDRTLATLVDISADDDELAEYYIGYKLQAFPSEAPKALKRILKKRPQSLRLYNAYALCEHRLGRPEKALEVWATAMRMHGSLGSGAQDDLILLWHSLIITQIDDQHDELATQSLLNLPDPLRTSASSEKSTTRHLQSRRLLRDGFDRMLLVSNWHYASLHADCLAWLTYFTTSYDLMQALATYSALSTLLEKKHSSLALEFILQAQARLIETHIYRQRPYQPALILAFLETSLAHFPANTAILTLHTKLTHQDRLRTLARTPRNPNPYPRSLPYHNARIAHLLDRTADLTPALSVGVANQHTIRAAFHDALANGPPSVQHALPLWLAGLHFELRSSVSTGSQLRAKSFFFDGLRALPTAKIWALCGLRALDLSAAEYRQVYRVMHERGLRLRIDVGELADAE